VERTFLGLWVSMGSLFEHRRGLHVHRLCKRADIFGNYCGCRFHTEAGGGCKQQERLSRDHVESDPRGEERDESATAYHDNFDVDHHDNSYDYHDADEKYDLHQHVNDNNNDCDNHHNTDDNNETDEHDDDYDAQHHHRHGWLRRQL
jgi:hypothetical protein